MSTEDLRQALGEIQGELKGLRASVEAIAHAHEARFADHETRLRSGERWRWLLTGGGLVVGTVLGYVLK